MQVPVSDVLSAIGMSFSRDYLLTTTTEKAEEMTIESEQEMMPC